MMPTKLLRVLVKGIAPVIREYVAQELDQLRDDLGPRVKALEARPTPEHVGPWRQGTVYGPQKMVQHDGACWFALVETDTKPGASDDWRLVAKGGRDLR